GEVILIMGPSGSGKTTLLVWEGKYDEYGHRREIDIAGLAMPLQRIETVDEPRSRPLVQEWLFEPAKFQFFENCWLVRKQLV
ncbi:MAG: hypothetical protein ACE5GO_01245, partial [Anaerolineales bacterium]